jgi:hypothetical protein
MFNRAFNLYRDSHMLVGDLKLYTLPLHEHKYKMSRDILDRKSSSCFWVR